MTLGSIGKSTYSKAVSALINRIYDSTAVADSVYEQATAYFQQAIAQQDEKIELAQQVMLIVALGLILAQSLNFALQLREGLSEADLEALRVPLLATSPHRGEFLHRAELPWPCAWVLGHEGQGVSPALEALATQKVRIAQPGGEESLNVAAAAAICLHASAAGR